MNAHYRLLQAVLRHDYADMREMYFEEPPTFDEIIVRLDELQEAVRRKSEDA